MSVFGLRCYDSNSSVFCFLICNKNKYLTKKRVEVCRPSAKGMKREPVISHKQTATHTYTQLSVCELVHLSGEKLCSEAETNPSSASISITIKLKYWTYWAYWCPKSALFTLDWRHVKSRWRRSSTVASASRVHSGWFYMPDDYVTQTEINIKHSPNKFYPKTHGVVDTQWESWKIQRVFAIQIFDTQTRVRIGKYRNTIHIEPKSRSFRCIWS